MKAMIPRYRSAARWMATAAALLAWSSPLLSRQIAPAVPAGRQPVLAQVDVPHSYYWRELYLPQLTSGPSSASFLPDGQALVYSMAGSLWRQRIDSSEAFELTHATGAFDYQPDVARDGRSVVFVRYDGVAMELWGLDLASGKTRKLTSNGAVNVEPRLSPDGRQLAWISTRDGGRFRLFVASLREDGLHDARALMDDRKSLVDRYYYAAFDHQVNPSWSPDGKSLIFVGNPEVAWGSGDLRIVDVAHPGDSRRVLAEETSWSARPEIAPDGRRFLYSSYHGRQQHQLWLGTLAGAAPLPLTFGDSEKRNARWSPDARRIAYIDNGGAEGNPMLKVMEVIGGKTVDVIARQRRTLAPAGRLRIEVTDGAGQAVASRISVSGSDGRAYAPVDAWVHADDGFDRSRQRIESHYFHCDSVCDLALPEGPATVAVQHGFAMIPWRGSVLVRAAETATVAVALQPLSLPSEFGRWTSADLHVHMNYGGHYLNTPRRLARQARAEGLDAIQNLIVNKEERIPDIAYFGRQEAADGTDGSIVHAQEFHSSFWGHLGLLSLGDHYLTPDFASYRHTALASPYPHNGVIADLAHGQGGLVGYVHPFDTEPDPATDAVLNNQLPADVAQGKVDYLEVVGFSDHKATAAVWYRLLNLGFRLPAGAGTDAMANYASLRGPVGLNRVFLDTGGSRLAADLMAALREGRGFVSNGPLLGLLVDGAGPGSKRGFPADGRVSYQVSLRSIIGVDHLELVHNGRVVRTFELAGDRRIFDMTGDLQLDEKGWLLVRAWNDHADPAVLDIYPYATTNPVWLGPAAPVSSASADARYFMAWIDRVIAAADARDDYNDAREKRATLDYLRAARAVYQRLGE